MRKMASLQVGGGKNHDFILLAKVVWRRSGYTCSLRKQRCERACPKNTCNGASLEPLELDFWRVWRESTLDRCRLAGARTTTSFCWRTWWRHWDWRPQTNQGHPTLSSRSAPERRWNNVNDVKAFYLNAEAGIWP